MQPNVRQAGLREIVLWMLRRRKCCRLDGMSMSPVLHHQDVVLVDAEAYREQTPRLGDVVIIRHPFQSDVAIIKRITAIEADGRLFIQGDNPSESTDSRSFGWVDACFLLGKVTSCLTRRNVLEKNRT